MPVVTAPFAEWLPDLPAFGSPGASEAKNVIPAARSYRQVRALSAYSTALGGYCRGATSVKDADGNAFTYAGTGAKLYRSSGSGFVDATRTDGGDYALGAREGWAFCQYGSTVLAATIGEPVQGIAVAGGNFAPAIVSAAKPRARRIAVVRDFVVLTNTWDATDGYRPQRVWWSAIDDPTDFDPSAVTQCDFQELAGDHGWIRGVVGGEFGLILAERAVFRMSYEGLPTVFRFDQIASGRGAIAAGSVIKVGDTTIFLGEDGWFATDGVSLTPIGRDKVDRWTMTELDRESIHRMSSAIDQANGVVVWSFAGGGNAGGLPNRLLFLHLTTGRWSWAEVECERLIADYAKGYTLDGLDAVSASLDALPASLDDARWVGGQINLGGFDGAHRLAWFTGPPLTAVLETGEVSPFSPRRAFVRGIRPLVDGAGAAVSMRLVTRERQTADAAVGEPASPGAADGMAPFRADARYVRVRAEIEGGFEHAIGVEVDAVPGGAR